jgi:hypothetical protein
LRDGSSKLSNRPATRFGRRVTSLCSVCVLVMDPRVPAWAVAKLPSFASGW